MATPWWMIPQMQDETFTDFNVPAPTQTFPMMMGDVITGVPLTEEDKRRRAAELARLAGTQTAMVPAPTFVPQRGRGGMPTQMYGVPTIPRGLGTGQEAYKPAGPRGQQIAGPMSPDALLPTRQQPMVEEEDEFMNWDNMRFLMDLIGGMQGGEPPTPYGFATGGGSRSFVSLPTMRRG